jgi:hypothetical protein
MKEEPITCAADLLCISKRFAGSYFRGDAVRRGCKDGKNVPEWPKIESSFDKTFKNWAKCKPNRQKVEDKIIREFKRKAHHYLHNVPPEDDLLEWLALLKHYGGPCRMVDFSYSPFVAAHFAINRAGDNDAVFSVVERNREISERLRDFFRTDLDDPLRQDGTQESRKRFSDYFDFPCDEALVCGVNPFRMNQRLTMQQGVFLCPNRVDITFAECLHRAKVKLVKYRIPADSHSSLLWEFQRMNVNQAVLFPDLQGFAESLSSNPVMWDRQS